MRYPNISLEKKLFNQGYQSVAGIDEVGRGAWAGPIISVAVVVNKKSHLHITKLLFKKGLRVKDSKLLLEKYREKIFNLITNDLTWSAGLATSQEIDKNGLTWANHQAIFRALNKLPINPDYLLLDMIKGFKHQTPFALIIDGDRKSFSVALASILAKVTRDRLMKKYHCDFPLYNFAKNKGYGTSFHFFSIKKYGICPLHRQSYTPIKKLTGHSLSWVLKPSLKLKSPLDCG